MMSEDWEGEGPLLEKGPLPPPKPTPLPPKTFDFIESLFGGGTGIPVFVGFTRL